MQKILGFIFISFLFTGCSFTNSYYILSIAPTPQEHYKGRHNIIGIEKIIVPKYLFKREIAVAKSNSQITFLSNAVWAEDLDDGLTQRLIGYLQKKFNNPNIYTYPWGVEKQPTLKIRVAITRFIAQGNAVYLDANWEIIYLQSNRSKAKLFSTMIPLKNKESDTVVSSMDKAFSQLEEAIALELR